MTPISQAHFLSDIVPMYWFAKILNTSAKSSRFLAAGVKISLATVGMLALFFCVATNSYGANDPARTGEYNLKAVNVYGFGNYIRWPSSSKRRTDFEITIYGDSQISASLRLIATKKKIANKSIVISKVSSPSEISDCEMIFIAESVPVSDISVIKERVAELGVRPLIIVDSPQLFQKGIDIGFCLINDRVRFVIDADNVNQNGLTIDAKLLRLGIAPDSPEFQQYTNVE